MNRKTIILALFFCLFSFPLERVFTQPAGLGIYFIDVGQGHSTLIVSPTGRTMLIDGGPDGSGTAAIIPLMQSLGLTRLDLMVATHYDVDHYGGLDEVAAVFPPDVAYDSGDLTAPSNSFFTRYLNAIRFRRTTLRPGTVIDLGGGAVATCIVVNGTLVSGGRVGIFGRFDQFDQRDNSASIGLLVQYGNFDFFVSGDLSGGGNNTTDVESTVSQLVGDVDVVQLSHHGSGTSSNSTFVDALKAEVGIIQASRTNNFGHPTIEVTDRFINSTPTSGIHPTPPDGDAPANRPPYIFQTQFSPSGSSVSHQGIAARGTVIIETDGDGYTVTGGRLPRVPFSDDGAESGIRTDFPPSVILSFSPIIPQAYEPVRVQAQVVDDSGPVESVILAFSINGGEEVTADMNRLSNTDFAGTIPSQPDGTRIAVRVIARDGNGQFSAARGGYFSGTTPIATLRTMDGWGVPVSLDFPARITGTVTVGNGTFSSGNGEAYVQDATGGIDVFRLRSTNLEAASGDLISVSGRLSMYNGVTMLDVTNPLPNVPFSSPFGVSRIGGGGNVDPVVRTISGINESVEGMLVQINDVRVIDGSIPSQGSNGNVLLADETGELTLRVLRETGIPGMVTPQGNFNIVGVVSQFDRYRPLDSGYQLLPRNRSDFTTP